MRFNIDPLCFTNYNHDLSSDKKCDYYFFLFIFHLLVHILCFLSVNIFGISYRKVILRKKLINDIFIVRTCLISLYIYTNADIIYQLTLINHIVLRPKFNIHNQIQLYTILLAKESSDDRSEVAKQRNQFFSQQFFY